MLAWHFIKKNKRMGYGDNRKVKAGKTYKLKTGDPELCENGMHGSKRLIDALRYAPGCILCRVNITGNIIKGDNKIVGRERMVLWMVDATNILHEFACLCTEDALSLMDSPDKRSRNALAVKRKWLGVRATDDELIATTAAACAARGAVCEAAWETEGGARDSAWAARVARMAWNAWGAAWNARMAWEAWSAIVEARDTAEEKQNRRLTSMVMAEYKRTHK